jgi:O-antigen/teichoic acid export membrane protein
MGEVKKQTVNSTLIIFLGLGVGVISRILMPLVISPEEIGVLSILDSVSSMVSTVFCLGFAQITLHLFPQMKDTSTGNGGYLVFTLLFSLLGIILGLSCYYLFESFFLGDNIENKLLRSFGFWIFPMILFRILFKNLDIYSRMLYRTVIGVFLEGFILKFVILISLILFWLEYINFEGVVYIYVLAFCLPGIILFFSLGKSAKDIQLPTVIFNDKSTLRSILRFGTFGLLTTASGVIIIFIDQLMLNNSLGTASVGIYSIMFFAGTLINIPARGIRRIASAVLSDFWYNKEHNKINEFYIKSANNQIVIALYLFTIGWACINYALVYLPDYKEGLYVFFFIGLGQLVDLMTGVNTEIIASSKYYKVNTLFNIVLAIFVVISNLILIDLYGLKGAAIASFISLTFINIGRVLFLWKKFQFLPFNREMIKILSLGAVLLIGISFIPMFEHHVISVIVLFVSISIVYWSVIFGYNLSTDLKESFQKYFKKPIS